MGEAACPGRAASIRGTLRLRITALAVAIVVGVLAITGVILVSAQHRLLEEQVDAGVLERADELVAEIEAASGWPPELDREEDPDIAWVLLAGDASLVEASVNASGLDTTTAAPDGVLRTSGRTPEGYPWRIVVRHGDAYQLVVGADLEDVIISTRTLTELLIVAIPAVALVLGLLVWWVVGRALRPVEAIRAEVATIGASDLARRVPQPGGEDEIARLASTMNDMLARLQDATERQRRFVADASHELRTPLTRLRSRLEVDRGDSSVSREEVIAGALAEIDELAVLSDDLLDLARQDAGASSRPHTRLDLDDLVLAAAERLVADGRLTVDAGAVSGAQVMGDRPALERLIGNLVDNAQRHATTTVSLRLEERDGVARLEVIDDGPGVPAGQEERIFERFTRIDAARDRGRGGTGLGLAIARSVAQAHGGTLGVDAAWTHGARFVLELPVAGH